MNDFQLISTTPPPVHHRNRDFDLVDLSDLIFQPTPPTPSLSPPPLPPSSTPPSDPPLTPGGLFEHRLKLKLEVQTPHTLQEKAENAWDAQLVAEKRNLIDRRASNNTQNVDYDEHSASYTATPTSDAAASIPLPPETPQSSTLPLDEATSPDLDEIHTPKSDGSSFSHHTSLSAGAKAFRPIKSISTGDLQSQFANRHESSLSIGTRHVSPIFQTNPTSHVTWPFSSDRLDTLPAEKYQPPSSAPFRVRSPTLTKGEGSAFHEQETPAAASSEAVSISKDKHAQSIDQLSASFSLVSLRPSRSSSPVNERGDLRHHLDDQAHKADSFGNEALISTLSPEVSFHTDLTTNSSHTSPALAIALDLAEVDELERLWEGRRESDALFAAGMEEVISRLSSIREK